MKETFDLLLQKMGLEMLILNFIVCSGIILIYCRVIENFREAKFQKSKKKREVKSVVETASMTLFFVLCYVVNILRIGYYEYHNLYLNIFAALVYIIGVAFNLLGRYYLGHNWGNNVVIYKDHTLVQNGVYKIVRHPLYASIIWMIYAVGVIYQNYMIYILNTLIFIPFMYYRAKQEEKELLKEFSEYKNYQNTIGMFFPKIFRKKVK